MPSFPFFFFYAPYILSITVWPGYVIAGLPLIRVTHSFQGDKNRLSLFLRLQCVSVALNTDWSIHNTHGIMATVVQIHCWHLRKMKKLQISMTVGETHSLTNIFENLRLTHGANQTSKLKRCAEIVNCRTGFTKIEKKPYQTRTRDPGVWLWRSNYHKSKLSMLRYSRRP